jgi:hypothetical protein
MALDRLETAEALFRRSIANDPSVHARRRLADVLSAQNSMAEAVNEYKRVLETTSSKVASSAQRPACVLCALTFLLSQDDISHALTECARLLRALGREDEIQQVEAIRGDLGAL